MSMMDVLYDKIGHCRIQHIRVNLTVTLCSGVEKQGVPMSNWSLDGVIELVQKHYHKIRFKSEEGWAMHSPRVLLTSKSARFH